MKALVCKISLNNLFFGLDRSVPVQKCICSSTALEANERDCSRLMVCHESSLNKYQKSVLLIQCQKSICKVQFTEIPIIRDDFYLISWPMCPPHLFESTVMKRVVAQVHRQRHLSCCVDEALYKLLLVSASEVHSSAIVLSIINSPRCWWFVKYHPFLFLWPPLLGQGCQIMSRVLHGYVCG